MIRFYDTIVVPVVNFGVRLLARLCFLAGMLLLLAVAMGWTTR